MTQYYTTQPTTTKEHTTRHAKTNALDNTTPPNATQHNTKHAATRCNETTTLHHTTKHHPTRHQPQHSPKTTCRYPPRHDTTQRTTLAYPVCRSSSTWLTLTGSEAEHKERSLCSGLQRTSRTKETPKPRARGMQPASPAYGAHAHVTTRSMRCTHKRHLNAQVHGTQERPHTQHKHRT